MPTAVASPVPRWSDCSAKATFAHAGDISWTHFVTCSAPWPTTTTVRTGCSFSRAWMTWRTIGRPQMRCRGLGRSDRIRVPAPAARRIAETLITVSFPDQGYRRNLALVPGRGFEPLYAAPKTAVLPLNDPGRSLAGGAGGSALTVALDWLSWRRFGRAPSPGSVASLMGSLVKKRRKRMRKKKHKKMLRRTRHQRRK